MFLHLSVILFTGGVWADTPWEDTTLGQTPPRHLIRSATGWEPCFRVLFGGITDCHRSVWDGLKWNHQKRNRFTFFVILIFRHLVLHGPWSSGLCSGSCGFTVLNAAFPNKHIYFLTSPGQEIYHHPVCLISLETTKLRHWIPREEYSTKMFILGSWGWGVSRNINNLLSLSVANFV